MHHCSVPVAVLQKPKAVQQQQQQSEQGQGDVAWLLNWTAEDTTPEQQGSSRVKHLSLYMMMAVGTAEAGM
jgi:hypothetical protein